MIDVKKVRQMTWLSIYEDGAGKKDLKMNQQSCRTYTALRLIETIEHPSTASTDPVMIPSELVEGESLGAVGA